MKKISRRKFITCAAGVAALTAVSGTWAFYHDESDINNMMNTNKYGNTTIEQFTPTDIQPGSCVEKKVNVTNTGSYPLVARVKMSEIWYYKDGSATSPFISLDSSGANFTSVAESAGTYTAIQTSDTDGDTNGDQTVIYKHLSGLSANWVDGGDGYWYCKIVLTPGASAGPLMENVIMADNADMGLYISTQYYSTVAPNNNAITTAQSAYDAAVSAAGANPTSSQQAAIDSAKAALDAAYAWQVYDTTGMSADQIEALNDTVTFFKRENKLDDNHRGYSYANYVLTITTEVSQATRDAVSASWPTAPSSIVSGWGM